MRRRREVLVAAPAAAAFGDEQRLIGRHQLADDLTRLGITDFRARGHRQDHVVGGFAGHVLALTVLSALRSPTGVVAVVEEGGEVWIDPYEYAAALSSVTAIGAAFRNELLATERRGARATGPGDDLDDGAVYEHRHPQGCVNPGLLARGSKNTMTHPFPRNDPAAKKHHDSPGSV